MRRERVVGRILSEARARLVLAPLAGALLLPGTAWAQFGPTPSYGTATPFAAQATPQGVAVGRFNADAVLDLAVVNEGASSVTILLGDGAGGFTEAAGSPISTGAATGPVDIAVGDVDGDGKLDLVTANFASNNVTVLLGNGAGGFAAAPYSPLAAGTGPAGIAIGEVTGDALMDIVVSISGVNRVAVLAGNGGLTGFEAPVTYLVGADPRDVALGQLNGTGPLDVVVTNFADGNISVLMASGTGTLATPVTYATGAGARSVAVANLNADAIPDLVVANRNASNVSVLLGNGDGTFAAAVSYAAGTQPLGLAVGDFNVDTKIDVAVTNFDAGTVTVLTGDGLGALLPPGTPFGTGTNPIGVGVGDFDGNGTIDLTVPNNGSSNVSVLLNNLARQADLSVTLTDGQASATPGTPINYTITVTNAGPNILAKLNLIDTLPALVSPVFTPAAGTYDSGTGDWTGLQLLPGGTISMNLAATVSPAATGTLVNTVTVSPVSPDFDPNADTTLNTATDSDALTPSANLLISKSGPASAVAGQNVSFTINVTNNGPSDAAGVVVSDTPPSGMSFVSNDCLNAFPCSLGAVTVGQTKTINATYKVDPAFLGALLANTATVAATTSDPAPGDNTSTASFSVSQSANVSITKTGPATVTPGLNVAYTLAVTNSGPSDAAGVVINDTTPAGLTFVSNATACTVFPCVLGGLTVGQTKTITSTFSIPASYAPSTLSNTASVTATTSDPSNVNNSSTTAAANVVQRADIGITNAGPASVVPGQNITYTLAVTNNGPSDAATVQVANPAPTGLTFQSNGGDCTSVFPCALGPLAAGQTKVIQATFKLASSFTGAGPIVDTATVTTTATDLVPGNDSANASINVLAPSAGLKITKTGPASSIPGSDLVYTLTVTNLGPSDAANVEVTDPAPAGLTHVTNSGDCTGPFPCALGAVPAGASRTITATFSVPVSYAGADPVENVASVSSTTADPDTADNSASAFTSLSGQVFFTLSPCRVVDTRRLADPLGGPPLTTGPARPFTIAGTCGVPITAKAVSINITVTQPTADGDLRVYPTGLQAVASAINYRIGQTRANNAIVSLGTGGALSVLAEQASGTVEFILDVNGYFE